MKFNSSLIALAVGLTIAIASYADTASARVVLNDSNLTEINTKA